MSSPNATREHRMPERLGPCSKCTLLLLQAVRASGPTIALAELIMHSTLTGHLPITIPGADSAGKETR